MTHTNLDTHTNEDNMTPREHAKWLVGYFERLTHESDLDVWKYGLRTAQEWLRLIETRSVSPTEVSSLIGIVHANRNRTSGWNDLAHRAYHWASSSGFSVPPPEEFWTSEGLPGITSGVNDEQMPATKYAETLVKHFEQNTLEDPNQELWKYGADIAKRWLRLIKSDSISEVEVSALIEAIYKDRAWTNGYFSLALGMYHWSKINGFSNLWPEDFRLMIEKP